MSGLPERIARLKQRIDRACGRADRDPSTVELLPVSKFQPAEALREALALGFRRFGENYVQEGITKAAACPGAEFVLIGPLQRNKAKAALDHFTEILTLDRPELAHRLRHVLGEATGVHPVWIQVDLWGEATKMGGCSAEDLPAVVEALQGDPRLPLQGFMSIPPPDHLQAFPQLGELRARWQDRLGTSLRLSMGMSGDLEAAVEAGSDQVRIGSDFFGLR